MAQKVFTYYTCYNNVKNYIRTIHINHINLSRYDVVIHNNNLISLLPFMIAVPRFVCSNGCGRSYKYKQGVKQHLRYECGVAPKFKCLVCDKTFKQRSTLNSHIVAVHHLLIDRPIH